MQGAEAGEKEAPEEAKDEDVVLEKSVEEIVGQNVEELVDSENDLKIPPTEDMGSPEEEIPLPLVKEKVVPAQVPAVEGVP